MRKIMMTLCLLTLAACNKPPQDVVPENPAASLPSESAVPGGDANASGEIDSGAVITVAPVKTDDCTPEKYVADVSWTLPPGVAPIGFEVRVESPTGGLLAFQNTRAGMKRSGPWVTGGKEFFLVDKQDGHVIAKGSAPAYDCQ